LSKNNAERAESSIPLNAQFQSQVWKIYKKKGGKERMKKYYLGGDWWLI